MVPATLMDYQQMLLFLLQQSQQQHQQQPQPYAQFVDATARDRSMSFLNAISQQQLQQSQQQNLNQLFQQRFAAVAALVASSNQSEAVEVNNNEADYKSAFSQLSSYQQRQNQHTPLHQSLSANAIVAKNERANANNKNNVSGSSISNNSSSSSVSPPAINNSDVSTTAATAEASTSATTVTSQKMMLSSAVTTDYGGAETSVHTTSECYVTEKQQPKRRSRLGGSSLKTAKVWRFFTQLPHPEQAATCQLCQKVIKATNSSTTGMIRHLKSCHEEEHKIVEEARRISMMEKSMKNVTTEEERMRLMQSYGGMTPTPTTSATVLSKELSPLTANSNQTTFKFNRSTVASTADARKSATIIANVISPLSSFSRYQQQREQMEVLERQSRTSQQKANQQTSSHTVDTIIGDVSSDSSIGTQPGSDCAKLSYNAASPQISSAINEHCLQTFLKFIQKSQETANFMATQPTMPAMLFAQPMQQTESNDNDDNNNNVTSKPNKEDSGLDDHDDSKHFDDEHIEQKYDKFSSNLPNSNNASPQIGVTAITRTLYKNLGCDVSASMVAEGDHNSVENTKTDVVMHTARIIDKREEDEDDSGVMHNESSFSPIQEDNAEEYIVDDEEHDDKNENDNKKTIISPPIFFDKGNGEKDSRKGLKRLFRESLEACYASTPLKRRKYEKTEWLAEKTEQFNQQVALMLIIDNESVEMLDKPGFRQLIKFACPKYEMPTAAEFNRDIIPNLPENFATFREQFRCNNPYVSERDFPYTTPSAVHSRTAMMTSGNPNNCSTSSSGGGKRHYGISPTTTVESGFQDYEDLENRSPDSPKLYRQQIEMNKTEANSPRTSELLPTSDQPDTMTDTNDYVDNPDIKGGIEQAAEMGIKYEVEDGRDSTTQIENNEKATRNEVRTAVSNHPKPSSLITSPSGRFNADDLVDTNNNFEST